MADVLGGTFGGYADVTEVVTAVAQTAILAEIDKLAALIPTAGVVAIGSSGTSEAHPDFDQIFPHTASKIQAEIVALKAAIDAAPTS